MEITLIYHGRFTDLFGKNQTTLTVTAHTAATLQEALKKMDARFRESVFQIAQNNKILTGDTAITPGNIDVFPPFSGG